MPLENENYFHCDLKDKNGKPICDVAFHYDPNAGKQTAPNLQPRPQWPEGIRVALSKVIAVVYPLTSYTTFYCCDDHAKQGIDNGCHMPPLPKGPGPVLTPTATDADVRTAAHAAQTVAKMRSNPS